MVEFRIRKNVIHFCTKKNAYLFSYLLSVCAHIGTSSLLEKEFQKHQKLVSPGISVFTFDADTSVNFDPLAVSS